MDELVAEDFTAPRDRTERVLAAGNAIWCLPKGMAGPGPEPVGTLICLAAMRDLVRRAGYAGAEVRPIDHPAWRLDGLVP